MSLTYTPVSIIIFASIAIIGIIVLYSKKDLSKFIFSPYEIKYKKRYYQFITGALLHGNLAHLMFNLITFYFFSFRLEEAIGSLNFLIIYFASQILSDIPDYFKYRNNAKFASIGASGAISGVVFAFLLLFPTATLVVMPLPIPLPAPIYAVMYLIFSLVANRFAKDGINHSAHFWGAVVGFILTALIIPNSFRNFVAEILKAI